ncbi:MAG: PD-(D/E)XK nuclease family protein [Promethearchaeota archaeon]
MLQRKFNHKGLIYEFKFAKRIEVLSKMPELLQTPLTDFFTRILNDEIPYDLFESQYVSRCSSFRVKGLQRGSQKKISEKLIEDHFVGYISPEDPNYTEYPDFIKHLINATREIYQEHEDRGYVDYKPSHEQVLTKILLENENALTIETPVWTRKPGRLTDFIQLSDSKVNLNFIFKKSITGHIDLLMFDPDDQSLIVVDYKPEGHFLRSLPQVAIYGLILKRILRWDNLKCISFRKEDAWLYDPEILRTEIEKLIQQNKNPDLPWRKFVKML